MSPHSKLEPCELSPELSELLQRTFSEPPPEAFHILTKRPKPSTLRTIVAESLSRMEPAANGAPEAVEMALRSIQRSWDTFEDGSIAYYDFLRTPFGVQYEIVSIEGRGRGVIASRDIKSGEVILQESPVIVYPATGIRFLFMMTLPQKALEAIFLLHNQQADERKFSPDSNPPLFCVLEILAGISDTNAFGEISSVGIIGMILLVGAMFNHSDRSNIGRAWDDGNEKMVFTSKRDIKKGEELEIDYAEGAPDEIKAECLEGYGIS